MAKAYTLPRYAATQYFKTGKRTVWLTLHPGKLCIDDGGDVQSWPLSSIRAGQMGQGEAEYIWIPAQPDMRLSAGPDFLKTVKAAIRGEPYTLPRTWRIPVGPVLLSGFLGLCALVWYFSG